MRDMGTISKIAYVAILGIFVVIAGMATLSGWWIYGVFSVGLGALFAWSAPFVFSKRWQAPDAPPTRRPVVKRRRR